MALAASEYSSTPWVRTLLDPAHAREYGCRGIPDDNQMPTLLLNGRQTTAIRAASTSPTNGSYLRYTSADGFTTGTTYNGTIDNVLDITLVQTGGILTPYFLVTHLITSTGQELWAVRYITTDIDDRITNPARLVATSATCEWIGKEINKGGYWESGYGIARLDSSGLHVDTVANRNMVTFSANAGTGVYAVSKFNNFDQYKMWNTKATRRANIDVASNSGALGTIQLDYIDYTTISLNYTFTPVFVTYYPDPTSSPDFLLRYTIAEVAEIVTPYNQGGIDGAKYDPQTAVDIRHLYDDIDLIFPASYNDYRKVLNFLTKNVKRLPGFMASLSTHFPLVNNVVGLLRTFLDGYDNMFPMAIPVTQPNQPNNNKRPVQTFVKPATQRKIRRRGNRNNNNNKK